MQNQERRKAIQTVATLAAGAAASAPATAVPARAQGVNKPSQAARNGGALGARLQGVQHFGLTVQNMERAFEFYTSLQTPRVPRGVSVMNPYAGAEVQRYLRMFLDTYFGDNDSRVLVLGINPGRFGAGITGITFTDPVVLEDACGIDNHFPRRRELSSIFFYDYATMRSTPRESRDPFTFKLGRSSFPSSHATQTFAVATVLADRYGWGVGTVAYAAATAVGAARILQERHWSSDMRSMLVSSGDQTP